MKKATFFLLLALAVAGAMGGLLAHADIFEQMGPGVFDQASNSQIDVVVKDVNPVPGGYSVLYQKLEDNQMVTARICNDDRYVNQDYTEADRALAMHERVTVFRENKAANKITKTPMTINVVGPWNGCIWPSSL